MVDKKVPVVEQVDKHSDFSKEYSQNVEINSARSSEIKYLFGERMSIGDNSQVLSAEQY